MRSNGVAVATYLRSNSDIHRAAGISTAIQTIWSPKTRAELSDLISSWKPDVIHSHNTFPVISPSLYWTAADARVPVVQTLHNFRLLCVGATFLRNQTVCEDCLGKAPWRGALRKCYRDSFAASTVSATALSVHRRIGTYATKISRYIALNDFCRRKFVQGGLPIDRVSVKPNFVDRSPPEVLERKGILFVGRLSIEKGIRTLISAAALVPGAAIRIAGVGPEDELVHRAPGVVSLGHLESSAVRLEMNSAAVLVVPSIWFENFPMTIVEAYAAGLPVIASRIGALPEIVRHGDTGLLFEPGNAVDLAQKIMWAVENPEAMSRMGGNARSEYEAKYTPARNYSQLMAIYESAIKERRK